MDLASSQGLIKGLQLRRWLRRQRRCTQADKGFLERARTALLGHLTLALGIHQLVLNCRRPADIEPLSTGLTHRRQRAVW